MPTCSIKEIVMRTTRRPIVAEKHKGDKGILSIYKVTHNEFMVRYGTLHHKKHQNHYSLRGVSWPTELLQAKWI